MVHEKNSFTYKYIKFIFLIQWINLKLNIVKAVYLMNSSISHLTLFTWKQCFIWFRSRLLTFLYLLDEDMLDSVWSVHWFVLNFLTIFVVVVDIYIYTRQKKESVHAFKLNFQNKNTIFIFLNLMFPLRKFNFQSIDVCVLLMCYQ